MATLIPEINWTDFVKIIKDGKIGELKSCEVKFNCGYVFTVIIPHGDHNSKDFIRLKAEYLGQKSNVAGGKNLEEILEVGIAVV